jgi:hypothetical protein
VDLDALQPPRVPPLPLLVAVPRLLALAAVTGLVLAAADGLRGQRPAGWDAPAVAAWALAVAWAVTVYVMVAAYDGHGGHTHPRYLVPGLAVLAVAGALGLDRLPGARRGLWIWGATLAQLALTGAAWAAFITALRGRRPGSLADLLRGVAGLLAAAGVPWPGLVLALAAVLVVAALALLGVALVRVGPQLPEPPPDGSAGGREERREEVHAELAP